MPRASTTYEVVIASPGDVVLERQLLVEVIEDWNSSHSRARGATVLPRRWELDATPNAEGHPQESINRQLIDIADILIAVFQARVGTPAQGIVSGTIEEIERFIQAGKPVLIFFSTTPVPRNHDPEQLRALNGFKEALKARALYKEFDSLEDLRRQTQRYLAAVMNDVQTSSPILETGDDVPQEPSPFEMARQYQEETRYQQERRDMSSVQGLDRVREEVRALWAQIESTCTGINDKKHLTIRAGFGPYQCVLTDNAVSVSVSWRQQYSNSLDGAALFVLDFNRRMQLPGEGNFMFWDEPQTLKQSQYMPEISRSSEYGWIEKSAQAEIVRTRVLADRIVHRFIDLAMRNTAGKVRRPG